MQWAGTRLAIFETLKLGYAWPRVWAQASGVHRLGRGWTMMKLIKKNTCTSKNKSIIKTWIERGLLAVLFSGQYFYPFFKYLVIFVQTTNEAQLQKFAMRQNCRKSSVVKCFFVYIALHIECRSNKKSLLQCYFLAFLPAGK